MSAVEQGIHLNTLLASHPQARLLRLFSRRKLSATFVGDFRSAFRGRGMEFDAVRPYVPGDDVRLLDWKVTARTGVPHIKQHHAEKELVIALLCDVSLSQHVGKHQQRKMDRLVETLAL